MPRSMKAKAAYLESIAKRDKAEADLKLAEAAHPGGQGAGERLPIHARLQGHQGAV